MGKDSRLALIRCSCLNQSLKQGDWFLGSVQVRLIVLTESVQSERQSWAVDIRVM